MNKILVILSFIFLAFVACDKLPFEKPEHLIKRGKMIDMLVDIHIAEATFNKMRYDSIMGNTTSADFYYSVLDKYEVPDSVFEKSFIFYVSAPRDFEKMYRKVMSKLSEVEQDYSGRKKELLELELTK